MNDLLQPLVDLLHPAQQPGDDLHNEPHSDEADQQRHQSGEDLAEAVAPHGGVQNLLNIHGTVSPLPSGLPVGLDEPL